MMKEKEYYNELAMRYKAGDNKAGQQLTEDLLWLIKKYTDQYCKAIPGHMHEDMVQEGCILLLECAQKYDASVANSFTGYMLTKLKYKYIHESRACNLEISLSECIGSGENAVEKLNMIPCTDRTPEDEVLYGCELSEAKSRKMLVAKAIRTLPSRNREVIRMLFYEMKSVTKIANKLGLSKQHISNIKTDSIKKLKKFLLENSMRIEDS